jgi:hypothetical protein
MSSTVPGFTGLNIDGQSSGRARYLTGITLAGGDRTLTRNEAVNGLLNVTVGHATNAIVLSATIAAEFAKDSGTVVYWVKNNDASLAATIKVAGGTGIVVAATKTAAVALNVAGTDFIRLTADA